MKTSTAITVVLLTLGTAFMVYSTHEEQDAPQPSFEANIYESLPEAAEQTQKPLAKSKSSGTAAATTNEIDNEWNSILDGYEGYQSEFERLESSETATGAGN